MASAILITTSSELANKVSAEIDGFLKELSRSEIISKSLDNYGYILPTNGTAKFFSALSVDDFIKKSSIISYSREALEAIHNDIENFASAEHLTAHANSIKVRFE